MKIIVRIKGDEVCKVYMALSRVVKIKVKMVACITQLFDYWNKKYLISTP